MVPASLRVRILVLNARLRLFGFRILHRIRKPSGWAILLIGVPGSGKSTVARNRFQGPAFEIHSTDAIRGHLYGDDATQGRWEEIETLLQARVATALHQGRIAIIDATHAQAQHRRNAIRWLRILGATKVEGLHVAVPVEVCRARNQARDRVVPDFVIEGMHRALTENPPSTSDGFDAVEIVQNN